MIKIFKKSYTNLRELQIDLFFKYVNWYKLLVKVWGIYPTFSTASDAILELKQNSKLIKRNWLANPNLTIAQVIDYLGLTFLKDKTKSDWYYYSINDILRELNIPERMTTAWRSSYNVFGMKRKNPKYIIVAEMHTVHIQKILERQNVHFSKIGELLIKELEMRNVKR